jgi:hypothetical protein
MFTVDPLFEARERGRRLQADAKAERTRPQVGRRLLADVLRCAADRLDPGAVALPLASPQR